MCIGVPSKVLAVEDNMAWVDSLGERRHVSLLMMDEPVREGDYLLIQVGNFAVEIIPPERAREAIDYLHQAAANQEF